MNKFSRLRLLSTIWFHCEVIPVKPTFIPRKCAASNTQMKRGGGYLLISLQCQSSGGPMGEMGVWYWGQQNVFSGMEVLNHSLSAREKIDFWLINTPCGAWRSAGSTNMTMHGSYGLYGVFLLHLHHNSLKCRVNLLIVQNHVKECIFEHFNIF